MTRSRGGIAPLHNKVEEQVRALRKGALRVADALELRGKLEDEGALESLRREVGELSRCSSELGPFARLAQGFGADVISKEELARNVSVLVEARSAAQASLESLKRIEEIGKGILDSMARSP